MIEVEAIVQTLLARKDDEEFYFRAVPRLPADLISQLIEDRPGDFEVILRKYNSHIQGGLPFDYCDVVANFWHVGEVVAELLSNLDDESTARMVADVVKGDPYSARWHESYLEGVAIPATVRAAFESLRPDLPEGDIPF